jgi:hypothetical protein
MSNNLWSRRPVVHISKIGQLSSDMKEYAVDLTVFEHYTLMYINGLRFEKWALYEEIYDFYRTKKISKRLIDKVLNDLCIKGYLTSSYNGDEEHRYYMTMLNYLSDK